MNYSKLLADGVQDDDIEIFPWTDLIEADATWSYNSIFIPYDFMLRRAKDFKTAIEIVTNNNWEKDIPKSHAKLLKILDDGTYIPRYRLWTDDPNAKFPTTHLKIDNLELPDTHDGWDLAVNSEYSKDFAIATKLLPCGMIQISLAQFGVKRL